MHRFKWMWGKMNLFTIYYIKMPTKCAEDGCDTRAMFDVEGGKGSFCGTHKKPGMVDVRSKRCTEDGCDKQPTFDVEGGKGSFCGTHKKPGMVDVKSKRCAEDGCDKRPVFDVEGGKGRFCGTHKKPGMVDVKHKRCILCPIYARNRLYKGYCVRCFIHTFPDNDIVRNHKTKERHVADFIRTNFPEYDLSFDKRIEGGCSLRRPDILIDCGSHVVVVEIDENQHDTYDCSCENKRLMELFMDAGGNRPIVMIRFNPDSYKTFNNKYISSCWGNTKDRGLCKVKDEKQKEWVHRLDTLKHAVKSACIDEIEKEINVIHLFYDGSGLNE